MRGEGFVIIFVCAFVGCAVWSMLFLTFASHYFLATIIDSSAGHDEVHYPSEGVVDWWWKPLFCLWVLFLWFIISAALMLPFTAISAQAYFISVGVFIWLMYPLGILSALYTSNWLFFLHPVILWRMLTHYSALLYVYFITSLVAAVCGGLLFGTFVHSFAWAAPTAFILPGALLCYGRQWGRFAWLSLNFAPRVKRRPRSEYAESANQSTADDEAPERAAQEVEEGMRAGLPPAYSHPHGIQTGMPGSPDGIVAGAPPSHVGAEDEEDEYALDKKPYLFVGDPSQSTFQESAAAPASVPAHSAAPAPVFEEEEDEWATDKKPYLTSDTPTPGPQSKANTPITNSEYYDQRHKKEKIEKAKAKEFAERHYLPPPSDKTPTFATAMFFGVWGFLFYGKTLHVWANMVMLLIVELVFLLMVVHFFPRGD